MNPVTTVRQGKASLIFFDFLDKGYYNNLTVLEAAMAITKETVEYVSHLARIELKPQELEKISGQLQAILDFIDTLKRIDIKDVPPTSHILPVNNVLREDKPVQSLSAENALMNAPGRRNSFFVVPKVIE
jgi:aspartyl-tRNA(Asn)/glutamyl-tRNA(Gln) amidotransferase subunit C